MTIMREIDVHLEFDPNGKRDKIRIEVASSDRGPLSAQDIIDAVSDVLIMEWDVISFDSPKLDS